MAKTDPSITAFAPFLGQTVAPNERDGDFTSIILPGDLPGEAIEFHAQEARMASSKCPRCGNENFEVRELDSQDSKPKLTVQCAACGAVVRVLKYGTVNL
ncbi:MAG TPA: hypothetical protein VJQ50_04425, partial [Terriglobales bacterium]|nr:hypothetical protein [Terriglobales bacterium]